MLSLENLSEGLYVDSNKNENQHCGQVFEHVQIGIEKSRHIQLVVKVGSHKTYCTYQNQGTHSIYGVVSTFFDVGKPV